MLLRHPASLEDKRVSQVAKLRAYPAASGYSLGPDDIRSGVAGRGGQCFPVHRLHRENVKGHGGDVDHWSTRRGNIRRARNGEDVGELGHGVAFSPELISPSGSSKAMPLAYGRGGPGRRGSRTPAPPSRSSSSGPNVSVSRCLSISSSAGLRLRIAHHASHVLSVHSGGLKLMVTCSLRSAVGAPRHDHDPVPCDLRSAES